jgi:acetylornithine deacetylase/succinyl-diaminopimelate desuccinylase-like protein
MAARGDVAGRDGGSRSLQSAMPDLQQETAELLQRLIRFKTVNPPGAERACQEHLAGVLQQAGFEVQLLGRTEERPNLVARLRGEQDGPRLVLLSHVDTVLADPDDWQRDPWSGEIADGELWGRGAQDMKNHTAAEVMAAVSLVREGWRPARGELMVVATVDEETGGGEGAVWLCEQHADLVRCDYVVNEGAGPVIPFDGRALYGVCVAEKGVFRFTLTTRGAAGHASMPGVGDNALLKMAPLLRALAENRPGLDVTDAPRSLLTALDLDGDGDAAAALDRLRERDALLAGFVEPMLSVTMAPTVISASEKINVLPAVARLQVDCRVPPGHGEDTAIKRVREVLGDAEYEIEFHEKVVGNGSRLDSPLMDAIVGWLGRRDPDARVVPVMLPAFTDSRTFREAFPDVVAYGFFPQRQKSLYEAWPLMHGKDERIDLRDVGLAVDCYRDVTKELLG